MGEQEDKLEKAENEQAQEAMDEQAEEGKEEEAQEAAGEQTEEVGEDVAAPEGEQAEPEAEPEQPAEDAAASEAADPEAEAAAPEDGDEAAEQETAEIALKRSPYVLGIDLGTSTSIVSAYHRGKIQTLDIQGRQVTPSVVNFRESGEALVGDQAKRRAVIDPDNTVVSIKRQMGDPDFKVKCYEQEYAPEDISAQILEFLKNGAQEQDQVDMKGTVTFAVVCVPANFEANKREATEKAGELAQLEVLKLLEEPAAAAIAYGFERETDQKILVYDLGGGTFDVCVLKVKTAGEGKDPEFAVLATEGISELGGDDFDAKLMEILSESLKEQSGIDLLDEKKDQGISRKKLRGAQQVLKEKAEQAKIELSEADSALVEAPSIVTGEDGQEHHLSREITREEFEAAIKDLIDQSGEAIKNALAAAKDDDGETMTADDIDRIILVGGSTRVPLVKQMVTEMFDKEPYSDIDPQTVVSQGAAVFGASLQLPTDKPVEERSEEDEVKEDIKPQTKTNHFLGIEAQGRIFSKLIEKGLDLPVEASKVYGTTMDDQDSLRITIFQFAEEVEYVHEEGGQCLGEFYLNGIPAGKAGTVHIDVTFAVNDEGLLKVSAASKTDAGIAQELEVSVGS